MIVDQSDWGLIKITGADRVRFVQGMCTINVASLEPGAWTRAAMLNAKGRVTSVIELVNPGDHLILCCEPDLAETTIDILRKYAVMDEVEFEPVSGPVYRVWQSAADVWDAPPVLEALPGPAASADEVEILRVEAGLPRYGVDVTDENFPFESPLARYIDYKKGCYLGQEPVSRVYFQGKPSKLLRGLRIHGNAAVERGTVVSHPERADAGTVTSSVVSPRLGAIALAYLHRSVYEPGTAVTVAGEPATIVELPFAP